MTNAILENQNDSKIEELMEELLNDYKGDLIKKEQEERDILDLIQMDVDILKNHQIPFYSEKYGVSPMDKQYLNLLLNFYEDLNNSLKLIRIDKSYDDSDRIELIKELLVTWDNQSEEVTQNINHRFEKYKRRKFIMEERNDSFSIVHEYLKNIYDKTGSLPSGYDFKFHKDSYDKLMETKTSLDSRLQQIKRDYDNSKKQCLRFIKKINHIINKTYKKGITNDKSVYLSPVISNLSPFLKLDNELNSISLNLPKGEMK